MPRRFKPDEFKVTDEERDLARKLGEGGAGAQATGSTIGSLAGGALGALGFLGGPALGAATLGLGAGLGGQIGSLAGQKLAEDELADAEDDLLESDEKRQRRLADYQLRQEVLQSLMGTR